MAEQINQYPLWGQATRANPQAVYEQIRNVDPVHRAIGPVTGNSIWFLTRYDDCVTFLKDQRFGKELFKRLEPELYERYATPMAEDDPFAAIDQHMLNRDPPNHTRLRALVHKAFTPRTVENLRPRIQQIADELIDAMPASGQIDLLDTYAFPLPITVIAEMLGIPTSDRERFRQWTRVLLFGPQEGEDPAFMVFEFAMYMNSLMDERQETPQDDVLTGLIQAEEAGDTLDRTELLSMIFLLLVAGHETTVNLIGNGALLLLQHPEQMQRLQANRADLMKNAVEEILRYNGPVETTTTRWAFEDAEIGGKTIPKGDLVLASLLAANRDPAVFRNPNTFDITREDAKKHIAFGNGIHYCVGAPLARLEGAIALDTLLARRPKLQLAVDPAELRWNESLLIHGLKTLPLQV